ncbi:MAG: hypothetical protein HZB16_09720 [Armatimonadetes bacterium]|nr:hypothetical protein [Armatimonadota bacterium]
MRTLLLLVATFVSCAHAGELTERWFFLSTNLRDDAAVARFKDLVNAAADHGYTGVCWSGAEAVARMGEPELARLAEVKRACAERKMEIVPLIFSVGYGGSALGFDPNLAVGHPVVGAPFVVKDGQANLKPDAAVAVRNAGFEDDAAKPAGWAFSDKLGELTMVDTAEKHSGRASFHFVAPAGTNNGHSRAMANIAVQPARRYRLSLWGKARGLKPAGTFRVQVYGGKDGPSLVGAELPGESYDWKRATVEVNSGPYDVLRLYVGSWGGQAGDFWLDDVAIEEVGLANVVRRDGCPLRVTSDDGQVVFEEGRDFEPVVDKGVLNFGARPNLPLVLAKGSRLAEGQSLRVSWYHAGQAASGQVSVCMSAPRLYDYYDQVAAALAKHLPSRQVLLSMDEIRQGGTDLADQQRGLTMGQILADCITRQQAILRRHLPGVTCHIWSDMLDPGHNGHGNYYQVKGDWAGAVDGVPKDLVIDCWWVDQCERSLKFFDDRGFRTLGAAYYDSADLEGSKRWLQALRATPRAIGIMYTTWQNKYALLAPFGDLARP